MINFFNTWLQGIIIAVVIATIIEMILPNGNNKKYVKIVIAIYVVFSIIAPIVNKFTNNNLEIDSIVNLEKYAKQFEKYEASSKSEIIEDTNQKNIEKIYINNLENDIKTKLKDKGFITKKVEIKIENNNTYEIKEIIIELDSNKKEIDEYKSTVNEIQIVNIEIKTKNEENIDTLEKDKSKVTHEEKTQIIKYISEVYGINEKNVTIY